MSFSVRVWEVEKETVSVVPFTYSDIRAIEVREGCLLLHSDVGKPIAGFAVGKWAKFKRVDGQSE